MSQLIMFKEGSDVMLPKNFKRSTSLNMGIKLAYAPMVFSPCQDMARVGSYYQRHYTYEQTLRTLTEAITSEVECLPYGDEELREKSGMAIEKPFGVVSVIPSTKKVGHEDSSAAEYDEEKAINYLKEKLNTDSAFSDRKTIMTALSAFQFLWHKKEFLAEEIWVTTWGKGECSAQHLRMEEKMWNLAVICKCSFASRSAVYFNPGPLPPLSYIES